METKPELRTQTKTQKENEMQQHNNYRIEDDPKSEEHRRRMICKECGYFCSVSPDDLQGKRAVKRVLKAKFDKHHCLFTEADAKIVEAEGEDFHGELRW